MHASFPPYTKPAPAPSVTAREAKLRTLKHYLYHAGLLADELIALESGREVDVAAPASGAASPDDRL